MGQSTQSDIVKNCAQVGDIAAISIEQEQGNSGFVVNGWKHIEFQSNDKAVGKKKSLLVEHMRKGDIEVCLLNTHIYSNGGAYDFAVFSDDRAAVETFLKDFNLNTTIEDMDSVCQTL